MSLTVERVKLGQLRPYPGNARRGDVKAIADSLKVNGQFRPLIVQRSTGYVLGGNHTLQAAQKLRWSAVDVTYLDVDDAAARRIVLADNRTADLGGYDDRALLALLRDLGDDGMGGTGYNEDDYADLLATLEEADAENPPQEPTALIPVDGIPGAAPVTGPPAAPASARQAPSYAEYEAAYGGERDARFLPLVYPPARYAWVLEKLDRLTAERELENHSEVLLVLLAAAVGEIPPPADAPAPASPLRLVTSSTETVIPTEAEVAAGPVIP